MIISLGRNRRVFLPVGDLLHLTRPREIYFIQKFLGLGPRDKLLDVGAGHGFWTFYLSRLCQQAVGIDFNYPAIAQGVEHLGSRRCLFCVSRAEQLPFPDQYFERVIGVCALEHFTSDTDALSEMKRVLKGKNSVLVLSVDSLSSPWIGSTYRDWHRTWGSVQNYYGLSQIREKLRRVGFDIQDSRYIVTSRLAWRFLCWAQRYPKATAPLIPLMLLFSLLADWAWGRDDSGYILIVKALPLDSSSTGATAQCGWR